MQNAPFPKKGKQLGTEGVWIINSLGLMNKLVLSSNLGKPSLTYQIFNEFGSSSNSLKNLINKSEHSNIQRLFSSIRFVYRTRSAPEGSHISTRLQLWNHWWDDASCLQVIENNLLVDLVCSKSMRSDFVKINYQSLFIVFRLRKWHTLVLLLLALHLL